MGISGSTRGPGLLTTKLGLGVGKVPCLGVRSSVASDYVVVNSAAQ